MMSGDLKTSSSTTYEVDGRWDGPGGPILVEVKKTSSVRDVRDAFLELAYLVRDEAPQSKAVCVIIETRLSYARLMDELGRFRAVMHPSIKDRVHFLVDKGDRKRNIVAFSGSMEDAPSEFYPWLGDLVASERQHGHHTPLPPRQIVVAALAQLRLWNHPPVTIKHLQETCQVSYPTVALVLKDLADKGWLEDSDERGVRLRHLTTGEWVELARGHARRRQVHLFTDPTGQSSPDQLMKRLARLQATDKLPRSVRIGGVMGASRHFPELDITAAPRLDLSVETDPAQVVAMLDAGLRPKTKPDQGVAVAVHVTHDPWVITDMGSDAQGQWAGELECLSDLLEMGFTREATEMAHHMALTNKEGRSTP